MSHHWQCYVTLQIWIHPKLKKIEHQLTHWLNTKCGWCFKRIIGVNSKLLCISTATMYCSSSRQLYEVLWRSTIGLVVEPNIWALQELSQSSASHQLKTKHKCMGGWLFVCWGNVGLLWTTCSYGFPLSLKFKPCLEVFLSSMDSVLILLWEEAMNHVEIIAHL